MNLRELLHLPSTPLMQALGVLAALLMAFALGALAAELLVKVLRRLANRTHFEWDNTVPQAVRGPARLLLAVGFMALFERVLGLESEVDHVVAYVLRGVFILGLTWLLVRAVGVFAALLEERATRRAEARGDAFGIRGVKTQISVLRRILGVIVAIVGAALLLLQIDAVRAVGVSVLASAGVAGIALGFAAQRSLGALFQGLQLSITQPLRLGDAVVIGGEFGFVEEINLTYVVVRVWDQRRLIVPAQKLLDDIFQNWTRTGSDLLGPVMLQVDFATPLDALRAKLDELLEGNPLWDGKVKVVHVTDASEFSMQVRVLVSAKDPGTLFDLRAQVRERLLGWLGTLQGGRYMPRRRQLALAEVTLSEPAASGTEKGNDGLPPG